MDTLRVRIDDELLQQAMLSHLQVLAEHARRSGLRVMREMSNRKIVPSSLQPVIDGAEETRRVEDVLGVQKGERWPRSQLERRIEEAA